MSKKTFPVDVIANRSYQRAYADPLIACAGSLLNLVQRDADWPGWIWSRDENGMEAWVPEAWLSISGDQGKLKQDYTSNELSCQAGDRLTLLAEESGWYWARNTNGEFGWIPGDCIRS